MASPTGDQQSYMSAGYYQAMNYPASFFTDPAGAWSNGTDTMSMSYLNNSYGQHGGDYMQFASAFDTYGAPANFSWPYQADYSSWGSMPQQPDPMTMDSRQQVMSATGYDYYQGPSHRLSTREDPAPTRDSDGVNELEQGMQMVSVNANGDGNHESPNDMTGASEGQSANINNSSVSPVQQSPGPPKPMSWAQLASKPAKPAPQPAPQKQILTRPQATKPVKESDWDKNKNGPQGPRNAWSAPRSQRVTNGGSPESSQKPSGKGDADSDPTLSKLKQTNSYNPKNFDLTAKNARFFVIKSYSEDDIHRAIKYGVWCSTEHGNKRLDAAFKERENKGPIYLLYSVNGSGHFCGMAQMMSGVDYQIHAGVWTQDKWKGQMEIKWIYVKDVPNSQLRHIRLENNENKPVTNSRDTQEIPPEKGRQVLKIVHTFRHSTSIFDDFGHYEKKEVEEDTGSRKKPASVASGGSGVSLVQFHKTF